MEPLSVKGYGHLPSPCQTCFYRDMSGEMRDPCFPCEQGFSLIGRASKFWLWTDGKMTEEQVEQWEELRERKLDEAIENDPEIERLAKEIAEAVRKG